MALSIKELEETGSAKEFIDLLEWVKVKFNLTVYKAKRNIAYLSYDDGFSIGVLSYNSYENYKTELGLPSCSSKYNEDLDIIIASSYLSSSKIEGITWALIKI